MAITGQAIVARKVGAPVEVEEITIDPPGPGEVLVRILATGVCHTDLHIRNGMAGDLPVLLGHEGTGIVEQVGEGVRLPKVGDKVILAWRAPCGICRHCRMGLLHLCSDGLKAIPRMHTLDGLTPTPALDLGTFTTHTVVHSGRTIVIPPDAPAAQTCLIGCGVMTGVGAALYSAEVRRDSTVAVFGCGGVGVNVIQGARIAHARTIIAVDVEERKLNWAKDFGATHTVNASKTDPVAAIKEINGGLGVDYTFECIGLPQTLLQAISARGHAGVTVLIGVPGPGPVLNLPMQSFFDSGGSLRISWYGDCLPSRDFPMLTDWYSKGTLQLDELVTQRIQLQDVEEAFGAMQRGETLRSVVVFPEN
jgi:S-(hydroxymethyl)mycothiol dehydrogenase